MALINLKRRKLTHNLLKWVFICLDTTHNDCINQKFKKKSESYRETLIIRCYATIKVLCLVLTRRLQIYYISYFKQNVSFTTSTVKISDEVPRDDKYTIETVYWTSRLKDIFEHNAKHDPLLR